MAAVGLGALTTYIAVAAYSPPRLALPRTTRAVTAPPELALGLARGPERRALFADRAGFRRSRGAHAALEEAVAAPRQKRVLVLISDTGGGHRASAQAVEPSYMEALATSIAVRAATWDWNSNRV